MDFRERAIVARSSSQALDERVRVVPLPSWLALGLTLLVISSGVIWLVAGSVAVTVSGSGIVVNAPANVAVTAPVGARSVDVGAAVGARVRLGDVVAVVGTDTGPVDVTAPAAGVVAAVGLGAGAAVEAGAYLATIAPDSDAQVAYLFIPFDARANVEPGMAVHLLPLGVDPTVSGFLIGSVSSVGQLPVTRSRLDFLLPDDPLATRLAAEGSLVEVLVALTPDATSPTGHAWTQPPGLERPIASGAPASGTITVAQVPPFRAFFAG